MSTLGKVKKKKMCRVIVGFQGLESFLLRIEVKSEVIRRKKWKPEKP